MNEQKEVNGLNQLIQCENQNENHNENHNEDETIITIKQHQITSKKIIQDASNIINDLVKKYENNEYMMQRIHLHLVNYLPNTLENECKTYEKRVERNLYLTNEQQLFIQVFLSKHQYYYLNSNNYFYEYDGQHYKIVKEDDIIYKLLSSISMERKLLQWKHKTKFNIVKQIKNRSLFTSIPETDTIQHVLNLLYPSIFSTKNKAKYFLTIIGDNIHKKNAHLIFLIGQNMRKIINEINNIAYVTINNTNTTHNFVTKYHETHSYNNCRLLEMNEQISYDMWREMLKKFGLDILCVAAHYSNRYESSDSFIETKSDEELKNYAFYLKDKNPENIVSDFLNSRLTYVGNNSNHKIEWKHLHFIWKQYLSYLALPNIVTTNNLKTFIETLKPDDYDKNNDCFLNHISKYLPIENDFMKFWENTITSYNETIIFDNSTIEKDYELDEICMLFKYWVKNNPNEGLFSNGNISENNVIKILSHFFPDVLIIDDKYILNIMCNLWDKTKDIDDFFMTFKENITDKIDSNSKVTSIEDIYQYYFKYCNSTKKYVVSKRYFEKYLHAKLFDYIVYEKFIDNKWFLL
jgi:hypothetical protein